MWSAWVRLDLFHWKQVGTADTEVEGWLLFRPEHDELEKCVIHAGRMPNPGPLKG